MKMRVLFFGATADLVGQRVIEVAIDAELPARTILNKLVAEFPQLNDHRLLFAINQEYCALETPIGDGDELAIFTAVSGG